MQLAAPHSWKLSLSRRSIVPGDARSCGLSDHSTQRRLRKALIETEDAISSIAGTHDRSSAA